MAGMLQKKNSGCRELEQILVIIGRYVFWSL